MTAQEHALLRIHQERAAQLQFAMLMLENAVKLVVDALPAPHEEERRAP